MPTISIKVDDAFLQRINKVCEWERRTQKEFVRAALENKIGRYKEQLDALEKAEAKILKTLPTLSDNSGSARVTK
jgi:predicted transcriptional regulator